jgi:hypothetical protein
MMMEYRSQLKEQPDRNTDKRNVDDRQNSKQKIDEDNFPEVYYELPQVNHGRSLPEVYHDLPEVKHERVLPELTSGFAGEKPPRRKRYKILLIACALVLLAAIAGGVGGGVATKTKKKFVCGAIHLLFLWFSLTNSEVRSATVNPPATTTQPTIQSAYSFPTAISPLPGRKSVFGIRSRTRTMWHKSFDNATWDSNFTTIGGPLATNFQTNIAVVKRIEGVVDTFSVGADNSCVQKHFNYTTNSYEPPGSDYILMLGDFSSSVEALAMVPTRIDLFGLTGTGKLTQKIWINGSLSAWVNVVGVDASTWLFTPTVVSWARGRGDVFVVDSTTLQVSRFAWTWSSVNPIVMQNIGGYCTSRPSAVSWEEGRIDVFCRDANGELSWSSLPPGTSLNWTTWQAIGSGSIVNEPQAVSRMKGSIDVFVQTANDTVAVGTYDKQTWTWQDLGGSVGGPPKVFLDYMSRANVFAMDKYGALLYRNWVGANESADAMFGSSNNWESLGTP